MWWVIGPPWSFKAKKNHLTCLGAKPLFLWGFFPMNSLKNPYSFADFLAKSA